MVVVVVVGCCSESQSSDSESESLEGRVEKLQFCMHVCCEAILAALYLNGWFFPRIAE